MTGEPLIDYEALTQNAMRSVVKEVLTRTANTGLPGEHHFYISFDTQAGGASVSKRLKGKYPTEMTIVLQHRFWDLNVYDDHFEVKLTFDGIPERLIVPYTSIKVFFDPSVRYGLQFEEPDFTSDAIDRTMLPSDMSNIMKPVLDDHDADIETSSISSYSKRAPGSQNPKASHLRSASDLGSLDSDPTQDADLGEDPPTDEKLPAASNKEKATASSDAKDSQSENDSAADENSSAEIVSLDAFRKK